MNERLTYLLDRYVSKTASLAEIEEFRAMTGLPEHEAFIKAEIEKAADEHGRSINTEAGLGEEIYSRIIEKNNIYRKHSFSWSLFRAVAAAAVVILAIGIGWYFSMKDQGKSASPVAAKTEAETSKTYRNKSYIRLPDGSTVMLKDSSELIVVEKDGKFLREVILKGEAFFDIAHDAGRTFVVHANNVNTRVLGTAFNIRTQTGKVEVKVTRGLVEVGSDQMVFGKIKAKEQIDVNTESKVFSITALKPVEKLPVVVNTALVFNETSLNEVFDEIAKRYHYQIFLENPELGPCRIDATFTGKEDLEDILDAICAVRNLEYSTELDKILIKGGEACK